MKWKDVRRSENIEDRRSQGRRTINPIPRMSRSSSGGMGSGLLWLLLSRTSGKTKLLLMGAVLLFSLLGTGMLGNLGNLGSDTIFNQSIAPSQEVQRDSSINNGNSTIKDEEYQFLAAVLATTEDFWHNMFQAEGATYREPSLVVYSGGTQTGGCGYGSAQAGPFYCPGDQTIYVDLQFYRDLTSKYNAPGDFAMAYVIAHEVGHHIQQLDGTMRNYNSMRQRLSKTQANELNVRLELQADYYAGAWAKYVEEQGLLEVGDLEEALQAAHSVGDDTLQKEAYGYAVPDSFTHGTSKQRQDWFYRGYQYGDFAHGDTFSGEIE